MCVYLTGHAGFFGLINLHIPPLNKTARFLFPDINQCGMEKNEHTQINKFILINGKNHHKLETSGGLNE